MNDLILDTINPLFILYSVKQDNAKFGNLTNFSTKLHKKIDRGFQGGRKLWNYMYL